MTLRLQVPTAMNLAQVMGAWIKFLKACMKIMILPSTRPSRPYQFCIYRVNGNTETLLAAVEYKPPYKLSVEGLRVGLRTINLYRETLEPDTIPPDGPGKLVYNAMRLSGSMTVREYHVMIQEGLEYSYLTMGLGNLTAVGSPMTAQAPFITF
ncbi:hypothetical protein ANOM_009049 [Aspergillus nomiae NRRL 13137]|uniref:Uncharacterized protein n=1 Tax=Aspergillus nomiae NRRL (strain ATCC 15546 / NRRL 13137 / CBS 260.88 / M93) TaxID=1509407 RepID=A0A0L1IVL7_ASPN3|nr:uncharacterized protein ANOM_009049 [Aspergillus nomiae NRRL 13137]KNG83238.1 hypothetical protein ANOM_009049 [Aspergillus nomiae NRRL 13137]